MEQHPYAQKKKSQYAPINETVETRPIGITSYMNEGVSAVREARREDAYKKMFNACNGKYKILGESSSETGDFYYAQNMGSATYISNLSSSYVYIKFECV